MSLRLEQGLKLVAATHNPGKVVEIRALLDDRFEIVSAGELGLSEPEETEATFIGNAVLKARAAADACGLIAIADDSGLSVAALGGRPGVLSARWAQVGAEGPRDFVAAAARIEAELAASGSGDRSAWFTSALAVAWPNGAVVAVEGRVDGALSFPARGTKGFGYDPIFVAGGQTLTFGEMAPAAKDAISHRARAFDKLKAALF
jgi:XTP/dITP diphosphohydrolase